MNPVIGIRAGLSVDHLVVEPIGARFSQLGGPGLFAALGAAAIDGLDVRLACGLPEDDQRFAEVLTRRGVDLAHTWTVPGVPHVWILNSTDGRRVVDTSPVRGLELDAGSDRAESTSDHIDDDAFFEGLGGLLVSSPRSAVAHRPPTFGVDPDQGSIAAGGWNHLAALLQDGDLVLPSRVQLNLLGTEPRRVAIEIADRFGVAVVARLDADGMVVIDGHERWSLRDPDIEVVETTGAGDASAGAIVAAYTAGRQLVEAAALGMSVARLALAGWGHTELVAHQPLSAPFSTLRITNDF